MNEFIVWDKEDYFGSDIKFYTIAELMQDEHMTLIFDSDGTMRVLDYDVDETPTEMEFETFNYIGKTDIEGKKIYADSSIVEFRFDDFLYKGYFVYNTITLRYDVRTYHKHTNSYELYTYDIDAMSDFKIIDTLQENPELLKDNQ